MYLTFFLCIFAPNSLQVQGISMPPPGTHIPSGAGWWLLSTVAVTESIFQVAISGDKISARLSGTCLTVLSHSTLACFFCFFGVFGFFSP